MIWPAIDLQNGNSVRLYQGQFNQETLVSPTPVQQARQLNTAGVNRLHLIDLDGAKDGSPQNLTTIKAIRQAFSGQIEVGGGIRSHATIETYLRSGIDRVILGSAAIDNPQFTKQVLQEFGTDQIVIGVDGREGQVATAGWLTQSTVPMSRLIAEMVPAGAKNFIVTDVARDGTMQGPNIELLQSLQQEFPQANIIASGGIRNMADIQQLQAAGIKDMVVGKSLYEGTLTLAEIAEVNTNAS
ncbi:1-(5-phosphoribosyl)-5-[(5-phosphoribosylamino)methylideneamino]imidazole-4-carboxamide isomerase [Limosilactobacillus difficilis]|uniref:1-(5-phosphoribosyl)-5-[(5- phosphoribosylamino)methylideneamino]imidazole-4- carboxamide isomerase n=1 Tax=Limosilactobacillus difficilis TaxID=2991838 RepID=UPI0024BA8AB0|nr:1-(5-phosphoribosyl)-5-[(5-phosphoribosylamino)methylideneamino]imidazole-4-carboxamide isomerase [Limosilactobacillus difficilis]